MEVEVDLNRERRLYEIALWAVTCGGWCSPRERG